MKLVDIPAVPEFPQHLGLDHLKIAVGGHVAMAKGSVISTVFGWIRPKAKKELIPSEVAADIANKTDKLVKVSQSLKIESGGGLVPVAEQRANYDHGQEVLNEAIDLCTDVMHTLGEIVKSEGGQDPQLIQGFFKGVGAMKDLAKLKAEMHNHSADKYAPKQTLEAETEEGGFIMSGDHMTQMSKMFEKRMATRNGEDYIEAKVVEDDDE